MVSRKLTASEAREMAGDMRGWAMSAESRKRRESYNGRALTWRCGARERKGWTRLLTGWNRERRGGGLEPPTLASPGRVGAGRGEKGRGFRTGYC